MTFVSVGMLCCWHQCGVGQRVAASISAPGMDGKAWEVEEGKRAPCTAMFLQRNADRNLAAGKLTFFVCVCVLVCSFVFQQDKKLDKQYEENTKSLFCPSVSSCLNMSWQKAIPCVLENLNLRDVQSIYQEVIIERPGALCLTLQTDESACFFEQACVWCIECCSLAGSDSSFLWGLCLDLVDRVALVHQQQLTRQEAALRSTASRSSCLQTGSSQHGSSGSFNYRLLVASQLVSVKHKAQWGML